MIVPINIGNIKHLTKCRILSCLIMEMFDCGFGNYQKLYLVSSLYTSVLPVYCFPSSIFIILSIGQNPISVSCSSVFLWPLFVTLTQCNKQTAATVTCLF